MTINTYFSQDTDLRRLISNELRGAKERVVVAVAWFTDRTLFTDLLNLHNRGVIVELIITNHEINDRSSNNYSLFNSGNSYFASIGEEFSLMHMKFCVIDDETVISGSANWTKAAFQTHYEQVTVTQGITDYASSFLLEFKRLRQITTTLSYTASTESTTLVTGTDLVDFTGIEYTYLLVKHGMLSLQLEAAVLQKNELERLFRLFDQLFARHLRPLLEKILDLKGKRYQKLKEQGYRNLEFEEHERAFREQSEAFNSLNEKLIRSLTPEETKELKQLYREAARKCHVDSPDCQYETDEANRIFSQLTEAYMNNDLEGVRMIHALVMAGSSFEKADPDNLRALRLSVNTLEQKLKNTWDSIKEMHDHEHFAVVSDETMWPTFFSHQKTVLQREYESLKK